VVSLRWVLLSRCHYAGPPYVGWPYADVADVAKLQRCYREHALIYASPPIPVAPHDELIPRHDGFVPKFNASATGASHWRTICA
jgi:hypothetical protein